MENFSKDYLGIVKTKYNKENSRDYAVSEVIKREVPEDKYFVAFGNDWSSSFSYLSERKSFTVPPWFKKYDEVSINPEHFIDENHLGGVVICPTVSSPTVKGLSHWASSNRRWKIGEVQGCYISVPEVMLEKKYLKISETECQGAIDFSGELHDENHNMLSIAGWTTISGENEIVPEKVYITLTKQNKEPIYFEALQINRPDVNERFGQPNNTDSGFSRIINTDLLAGSYAVGIVRLNQGHFEACQFKKEVLINEGNANE